MRSFLRALPPLPSSTVRTAPGSRVLACLLAVAAALVTPAAARAQADDATVDKVTKMNRKAVEEYDNLNFEEARKILKDALDLCAQNGLDKHPIKARTHLHLGVVILAGFKQREVAIKQFRKALEIQPDIKLTKSLANPEIQEAFDEAAAGAGKEPAGGTGGDADDKGGEKPSGDTSADEKPSEPFSHKPVTQATQGKPIVISAIVDPALGAKRVVLAYRSGENGDFLGREMKEVSPNKWASEIPATATSGNRVSYYVEAQKDDGESLAGKGSADDPLVVSLKGAGAPEPEEGEGDEDDGQRHWFIGLGIGSGVGWTTGYGEVNALHKIDPPGFAPSSLLHFLPEIGYFIQPGLLLSAQLRFQYVTGPTEEATTTNECGSDHVCATAKNAIAGFAKVTKFFGEGALRPFAGAMVGGGYVRHVAKFPSAMDVCGPPANNKPCVDTVLAGPILVGANGGVLYNLTPAFALMVGASPFLGFSHFTFHVDFNAGAALQF